MNLNKSLQLIDNSFSELPDTKPIHINSKQRLSGWAQDKEWMSNLANEYLDDFIKMKGIEDKDVKFEHHYVTDEVCIWINDRWSGYIDENEIEKILLYRKEQENTNSL